MAVQFIHLYKSSWKCLSLKCIAVCKRLWEVAYPVSKQTGRKFVPLQLQSLTTVCSFRHMQLHEQDWHPYVPSIFPNQLLDYAVIAALIVLSR
eukprot:jgi/Botrbrau1/11915/Bobra.0259s0004.1